MPFAIKGRPTVKTAMTVAARTQRGQLTTASAHIPLVGVAGFGIRPEKSATHQLAQLVAAGWILAWKGVYQAQSCLGHAEGCFRRLQTQSLPFVMLAFQRGREAETRTAAEPCAPESEGTFRVRRPGTIAMVSGMATSLVGRQSTVRASPDGSGLTGADGPPSQH